MPSPRIHLVTLVRNSWEDMLKISLTKEQLKHLRGPIEAIAQSKYEPHLIPTGIYLGKTPVGFLLYGKDPEDHRYWLISLGVDTAFQGKSYGKKAVITLMHHLKKYTDCKTLYTSYMEKNVSAKMFFESLGFTKNGQRVDTDEIVMIREL